MEIIDNINKTLKEDLAKTLKVGSKVAIAASCFSIYAFQELKEQLSDIAELRFIFTSPSFTTEKTEKAKREFYIPRLNRERDLYGTEFGNTKSTTKELTDVSTSTVPYDLVGDIARGARLTRRTVAKILKGIGMKALLFKNNLEEFIRNTIKIIREQKASMIVDHITYNPS